MAILIPSKNIYGSPQNQKIRDNIIRSIEVNGKEIIPENEYDTAVYNTSLPLSDLELESNEVIKYVDGVDTNVGGTTIRYIRGVCGINYKLTFFKMPSILLPKNKGNKYISKVYDGVDEHGDERIKADVRFTQSVYTATSGYFPKINAFLYDFEGYKSVEENQKAYQYVDFEYNVDISNDIVYSADQDEVIESSGHSINYENGDIKIASHLLAKSTIANWSPNPIEVEASVVTPAQDQSIYVEEKEIDGIEYYELSSIRLLVGVEVEYGTALCKAEKQISSLDASFPAVLTKIVQTFQDLTITVNGNSIGISIKDKTIYVNSGGAKEVFSFDGNELLQESNYYKNPKGNTTNAIKYLFGETQKQYKNGLETATIRCDIAEYYSEKKRVKVNFYNEIDERLYCSLAVESEAVADELNGKFIYCDGVQGFVQDYDENNVIVSFYSTSIAEQLESGEIEIYYKEISVDNSTRKMTFDIYDKVIPMVYGADGKDRPMSNYKDGTPKVFQVLGKNPNYDGAVWQELSLQEVAKVE